MNTYIQDNWDDVGLYYSGCIGLLYKENEVNKEQGKVLRTSKRLHLNPVLVTGSDRRNIYYARVSNENERLSLTKEEAYLLDFPEVSSKYINIKLPEGKITTLYSLRLAERQYKWGFNLHKTNRFSIAGSYLHGQSAAAMLRRSKVLINVFSPLYIPSPRAIELLLSGNAYSVAITEGICISLDKYLPNLGIYIHGNLVGTIDVCVKRKEIISITVFRDTSYAKERLSAVFQEEINIL